MAASRRTQQAVAERRARVLAMRAGGATFAQIAEREGHKTPAAAVQDARRALAAKLGEQLGPDLADVLESDRLDTLERITQNLLRQAADPDSPTHDPALALRAVDRLIRISYRRTALAAGIRLPAPAAGPGAAEDEGFDEVEAARERRRRAARADG